MINFKQVTDAIAQLVLYTGVGVCLILHFARPPVEPLPVVRYGDQAVFMTGFYQGRIGTVTEYDKYTNGDMCTVVFDDGGRDHACTRVKLKDLLILNSFVKTKKEQGP